MASHISPSKMETKASSSTAQDFIDYGDVCRICGSDENSLNLIGIYSNEGLGDDLPTKINTYLPVTVASTDDLPLQCCTKCVSTLNSWHVFVNNSVEADSKWKNFHVLASSSNKLLNEEEGDDGIGDRDDDQSELDDDMPLSELVETKQEPEDDDDDADGSQTCEDDAQQASKSTGVLKKCPKCNFTSPRSYNMKMHMYQHSKPSFTCPVCGKTFQRPDTMEKHKLKHVRPREKPFKCDTCHKELASKITYDRHLKLHLNNPQYVCDYCGKSFKAQNSLFVHKKYAHDTTKAFTCEVCGLQCKSKSNLNSHARVHSSKSTQFVCDHCQKSFKRKDSLANHLKYMHDKSNSYPCEICGVILKGLFRLKDHMRIHGDVNLVCHVCEKKFKRPDALKKHVKEIHEATGVTYDCNICQSSFAHKRYLANHLVLTHKIFKAKPSSAVL